MKLLIKRREFNLETHFAFVDYEKASDKVKWQKLFIQITNVLDRAALYQQRYLIYILNYIKFIYII
jgi:hypothetical protein